MNIEFLVASAIGVLTASGIYLTLRGRTFPVVLGIAMLSYAINVFLDAGVPACGGLGGLGAVHSADAPHCGLSFGLEAPRHCS